MRMEWAKAASCLFVVQQRCGDRKYPYLPDAKWKILSPLIAIGEESANCLPKRQWRLFAHFHPHLFDNSNNLAYDRTHGDARSR